MSTNGRVRYLLELCVPPKACYDVNPDLDLEEVYEGTERYDAARQW